MNTAQLTTLLDGISVQHVVAFFWVLARITPLFVVAPGFSSQMLVPRVRSVLAVAIAIGLTPVAQHGHRLPTDLISIAGGLIVNFTVGFALAYTIACVFGAVQGAGVFADSLSGFSFGQTVDPVNGNAGGSLTNLYSIVGLAIFLAIGGDAWTLRGFASTFTAVPLGHGIAIKPLTGEAVSAFAALLVGALEIAAPVFLAVTVADVAFGMVSKVVPQLNIFAVGFPVKVGVSLLMVGVSLPFLGNWMTGQLETSLSAVMHAL
jgi:flagellar biosynthetic protein FliR